MPAGDFELLATYISIYTKGLDDVVAAFNQIKQLSQQVSKVTVGVGTQQAAAHANAFSQALDQSRLALLEIQNSEQDLQTQLAGVLGIHEQLQGSIDRENQSLRQQLQLQRLIRTAQAQRNALQRNIARQQTPQNTQAQQFQQQFQQAQLAMLQIAGSGATVQQQLTRLAVLQQQITALMRQGNLTTNQQIQLQRLLNTAVSRQAQLQAGVARQQQAAINATQRAYQQGLAALQRMGNQIAAQRRQIQQLLSSISLEVGFIAPFTRVGTNIFRISSAFRQLAQSAGFSAAAIRTAGVAGALLATGLRLIQGAINAVSAGLRLVAHAAGTVLRGAFQVLLGPTLALVRAMRLLAQTFPLVATAAAALAGRTLIKVAQQLQQIESSFRFAFGAQAAAQLQYVTDLAQNLGVPLQVVAENYARISAASRDAGISQTELQTLFEGTSAAAVALGLDVERVGGLFFAFEQIISKGKLTAEELRRQIGDRLPGAFNLAARALGVTTERLDQLLEQGAIRSDVFIRAIGREMLRTFGPAALQAAQRITATMNRLRNTFFLLTGQVAQQLEPVIVRLINRFIQLGTSLSQSQTFKSFISFLQQQLEFLDQNFNRITRAILGYFERLAPAFQRLGRLMLVLNTAAVGVLVEGFARLAEATVPLIGYLERFVRVVTGIDLSQMSLSLESVLAVLQQMPNILELVILRVQALFLTVKAWFQTQFRFILTLVDMLVTTVSKITGNIYKNILRQDLSPTENPLAWIDESTTGGQQLVQVLSEIEAKTQQIQGNIQANLQEAQLTSWARVMRSLERITDQFLDHELIVAHEFRQIWLEVGDDVTSNLSRGWAFVRNTATSFMDRIAADWKRSISEASSGLESVTGGGSRVTVLAQASRTRGESEAARTAQHTGTLVKVNEALLTAVKALPQDTARALGLAGVGLGLGVFPSIRTNR